LKDLLEIPMHTTAPIVSTQWLTKHLDAPDLRVVDATWHVLHPVGNTSTSHGASNPTTNRQTEFSKAHIPGAVFFDIEEIADTNSPIPTTLPSTELFERLVGALGIGNGDLVVAYGTDNFVASARVWWMFRVFGHERVAVLDGGFPKWQAEDGPIESGMYVPKTRHFTARFQRELLCDIDDVLANLTSQRSQILDARSPGRFAGIEPERREGLRGGHIPGSFNLPYERFFHPEKGTLLLESELRRELEAVGLDPARPVVTTCGTGVVAPILSRPRSTGGMAKLF
jgi:thiosulfate/3-mercaptopyruvate sulfurtransferase